MMPLAVALLAAVVMAVLMEVVMAATPAPAQDKTTARVPLPAVKIEKGDKCVEPTDEMLRNHMNMLFHQREETVRRGIRTPRYSLKGCIECHANPTTHSVIGKDGFCESCHTYAAVRIDCFECHSPSPRPTAGGHQPATLGLAASGERVQRVAAAAPAGICVP